MCGQGYKYAGQVTPESASWAGIQGWITAGSPSVPNTNTDHIANWLGVTDTVDACAGRAMCWIQGGYDLGNVSGKIGTNTPYSEYNALSPYGYNVTLYPGYYATRSKYLSYYKGYNDANGYPMFEEDIDVGFGPAFMGSAALPHVGNRADAESEVYDGAYEACPTLSQGGYIEFGTDGHGNYGASWALYKLNTGGSWSEWAGGSSPYISQNTPYHYTGLHSWSAFKTNGGA